MPRLQYPPSNFADIFSASENYAVSEPLYSLLFMTLCFATLVELQIVTDGQRDRHTTIAYTALSDRVAW